MRCANGQRSPGRLPAACGGGCPARLIYATAWDHQVPLVTADVRIRGYAQAARDVEVIW
jgi:hypothetical protein